MQRNIDVSTTSGPAQGRPSREPLRRMAQATAVDDGPPFGVLLSLFLFVALIAGAAGSFIGEARYATTACSIGPDAPGKAYTRPVLRCELPWWWRAPAVNENRDG